MADDGRLLIPIQTLRYFVSSIVAIRAVMPAATLLSPVIAPAVQVWLSAGSSNIEDAAADGCLSPAECELAERLTSPERRRSFVAARHLGKQAVGALLEADTDILSDIEILSEDPTGITSRPLVCLNGQPADVKISISHLEDTVAVAVTQGDCQPGIDLGRVQQQSSGFADFWMTEDERQQIEQSDDPALTATMNWTAREAAFKASSLDTEFRPAHWSVLFDGQRTVCFHRGQYQPLRFRFFRVTPTLLLTTAGDNEDVSLHIS